MEVLGVWLLRATPPEIPPACLASLKVPFTSLRPGPWMENLFFPFVQRTLEASGVLEYVHTPGKGKSWVCADDASRIMIEALRVPAASKRRQRALAEAAPTR